MSTSSLQAEKTVYTSLTRRGKRSLNNNSFLGKYECSSLALDRDEKRDEKKRLDHLKQDQTMLVIKRFSERKKVFRERKKTVKIRAKRWTLVRNRGESFWEGGDDFRVDVLRFHTFLTDILGFLEKFRWWFEQDIDCENEDDNEKKLVMVNEE
ncbi:hypothetical protein Tco_0167820 [Tanacetum coccineum]